MLLGASVVTGRDIVVTAFHNGMHQFLRFMLNSLLSACMLCVELTSFILSHLRYADIPVEDIRKICPACRGICNCKVCLRGDNLIKVHYLLIQRS